MTIGQKQLHINDIMWHCLSIFYARKNIASLLNAINDFCEIHKNWIKHFSFYLSNVQGERVNLVFILENIETLQATSLLCNIEKYFERFLEENPSENLYPIPYGSVLWLPYPNNSLVWNAFSIPRFLFESEEIRDFAQATSRLIVHLYDAESFPEENVISIAMFLFVKLQKKQNIALPVIPEPELAKTLQSYWEYEENELLTEWMKYAHIDTCLFIICSQLNLSENIFDLVIESDKRP